MWSFFPPPTPTGGGSGRTGSSTPSAFSAQQDNLVISLTAAVLYWSSTVDVHITGVVASTDGDFIRVKNVGSKTIVLDNLSGSSSSNNQFNQLSATYYPVQPGGWFGMIYDGNNSKWEVVSNNNGA